MKYVDLAVGDSVRCNCGYCKGDPKIIDRFAMMDGSIIAIFSPAESRRFEYAWVGALERVTETETAKDRSVSPDAEKSDENEFDDALLKSVDEFLSSVTLIFADALIKAMRK